MKRRKQVVIGLLGTSLDRGQGAARWEMWRPSVSLCQHDDLLIDRFELLHDRKATALATVVEQDIQTISPETEVRRTLVETRDPWDFEEVYGALLDFSRGYKFVPEREDYLVHITTGTHVAQICLFLLTESRHLPAELIQTSPPERQKLSGPGKYTIIDLDLSKYDRLASRFQVEQREARSFLKSGIATRNKRFKRSRVRMPPARAVKNRATSLLPGIVFGRLFRPEFGKLPKKRAKLASVLATAFTPLSRLAVRLAAP